MTIAAGAKPHPIFLAGRWVDSPDPLVVTNPADRTSRPARRTHATDAQYEEAVEAAVAAFEVTRHLPAYERGAILREISAGHQGAPRGARPADRARGRQADPRRAGRGRPRGRSPSGSAPRRPSG